MMVDAGDIAAIDSHPPTLAQTDDFERKFTNPLDPEYPSDRIDYILADCGIQTIVTTAELADKKQLEIANIVCVDAIEAQLALESTLRDRLVPVGARDLSYVIYTSGSTGRPKGVEIEHRSSRNYIQVVNETVYHATPNDRLDRKSLPAPQNFGLNLPGKTTGRLASNQVERDIATAWETVFGMTEISIDDEFFNPHSALQFFDREDPPIHPCC